MIKNIVFDFGNVIGKFDPDYICGFYCDKENLETFKDIVFDKWADLDAGYIEYDDFKNEKIDRLPDNLKEAGENFFKDWYTHMPLLEETKELVRYFKAKGMRLFLLSNAPQFFADHIDYFKEGVESLEDMAFSGPLKMAKPDKEIYLYAMKKFNTKPEECLFLDDKAENVTAARLIGMNALVYKGEAQPVKEWYAVFG